ncbi:IclR family transcriptional regulator [Rhizorhabdus wittichii]|jgi:DNA-binding IclR family transcriptional regulator|uniref:IclR family transcriptional regulator n=1 Tax=Rhizorhabdus wittichii TaxID=160791 RepID=A0A975CYZ8_9SPHN|nr:IclR family transcriptional regulator [Rhizorhabdus wittichii]QTH20285.1 IclR family transcriptional regulator [Rhizorhabdus wittichii]
MSDDEQGVPGGKEGGGRTEYPGPRSPLRVMQIVETLAENAEGTTLARLSQHLDIPKTSVLNHLRVLANAGYVSLRKSVYVLGPAALRMGIMITANSDALAIIEPILQQLAEESGETTILGLLDERTSEVVYIQVVQGRQDIRYSPPVGTRRVLYSSGMGRALLAFQSAEMVNNYLDNTPLERRTPKTVTSKAELLKILDSIKADGISVVAGESLEGLGAIAAPIFDRMGQVRYAMGVAVPVSRLEANQESMVAMVRSAAKRASWAFGG